MMMLNFLLAAAPADDAGIVLIFGLACTLGFLYFCAYCIWGDPPGKDD